MVSRAPGILVLALLAASSALAQTPTLVPSTTQLTLTAVANGPTPLAQIFTVAASDGSFLNIETLVDAGMANTPAPAWITVTPHLAITPAQVQVAADATGLDPGNYFARIQFTDLKGNSLGSPVTVTLQAASAPAALAISPALVSLQGPISQGYLETGIFLRNTGAGTLAPVSVTVTSGYPWLSTIAPATCDSSLRHHGESRGCFTPGRAPEWTFACNHRLWIRRCAGLGVHNRPRSVSAARAARAAIRYR
jgi:hypothetical protein